MDMKSRATGNVCVPRILAAVWVAFLAGAGVASAQSVRPHHPSPLLQPQPNASGPAATANLTAAGKWTPLVNPAPENIGVMLLLSDGTVMANGYYDNTWYRLTPDSSGSYEKGTWSQLASMNYQRLYFQSAMLPSGKIFVSGGEYGNAPNGSAELYDPVANSWTELANATTVYPDVNFVDGVSMVLPNGNLLAYSVSGEDCIDTLAGIYEGPTLIYNVAANSWSAAACSLGDQDETTWVKLPDDSILSLDLYSTTSERYIPSTNEWIADVPPPLDLFNVNGELGGAFLLPNGSVFFIGGTNQTLVYTPSGDRNRGTWVQGPSVPNEAGVAIGANDAPAAMMANGNVLMAEDPYACGYCGPTYFFVYDYQRNKLTPIDAPGGGGSLPTTAFVMDMLDLPDGSVLLSPFGSQLYTFKPAGGQLIDPKLIPVITAVTKNADGSYRVTGKRLNGISAGATYGDENQNASNYPIARLNNIRNGNVYYARTFNWSSTGVSTDKEVVSTQMTLPAGLPRGQYLLSISANGISSYPWLCAID
jgi:hypothetical protein